MRKHRPLTGVNAVIGRAKLLDYLMKSELGADCEELALHSGLSLRAVQREIQGLRSLPASDGSLMRLVPIVRRDKDGFGKPSILVYKWGWAYDAHPGRRKSNVVAARDYRARNRAAEPTVENLHAMSSIFALGQSMTL